MLKYFVLAFLTLTTRPQAVSLDSNFADAWAAGSTFTPRQAIDLALNPLTPVSADDFSAAQSRYILQYAIDVTSNAKRQNIMA